MKNPPHPGELIGDGLEELGVSVSEAARVLGITRQQLHNLIAGRSAIKPEMAIRLEKALGSTAEAWLRMQVNYAQMRQARTSMAMAETVVQGSPFWRFSLRFYRQPGVADACIALQDGCGVDVNILLFLLWLAGEHRRISAAEARSLCATAAPWRDEVVAPLRALRRRLKGGVPLVEDNAAELFRTRIKAVELEAERLQQEALFALAASLPTAGARCVEAAARANVAAYEAALAVSLPPAATDVLFAALPPGAGAGPRTGNV